MIDADLFIEAVEARSGCFFTGVPCSFLSPLINRVIGGRNDAYLGATSEGEAVALAAGAWLAGRDAVVMCQNSGLGNMVNPLTSLNWPFRIPALLVVTWRGQPGRSDEPQHELMGQVTGRVLEAIRVPYLDFPSEPSEVAAAMGAAHAHMDRESLPFALIMAKGAVAEGDLDQPPVPPRRRGIVVDQTRGGARPGRAQILDRTLALAPDSVAIVATTGKCGRELFTLADRPQHLYLVGSMGCASAVGLGVAVNCRRTVLVLDGDGAALMKLGNLATIGTAAPPNLIHVVLDNGVHDSTGGQATVSTNVDFADIAAACGYARAATADDEEGYETALRAALASPGPHMIHARISAGSLAQLGRPTVKPAEVARRFRAFLTMERG